MKRIIILITLAGAAVAVQAQKQVINVDTAPAKAVYATPEWNQAFMGYFGVNTETEPGIPENEKEREVLAQVKNFLQSGSDSDMAAAVNVMENLIREQQSKREKTSPMMLQIAGTLLMRQSELTNNPSAARQIVQRSEQYLKMAVDPTTGFPNFLRAHKNLANLLFRNDKQKEAKIHFLKAIQLGDQDAISFGMLGAIFMEEGKLISSEGALRQSLMLNPNISQFKQLLGNVLLQQERYAEAKEIYAELLMKSPNEAVFWMAQANCYIAMEEIDKAARNLEIVRFMGKSNTPSLMLLGDVYMNKTMIDEATEVYLQAVNEDASKSNLTNYIASVETLNNYAAYEQAMEVITLIEKRYSGKLTDEDEIDLLSLSSEINISLGKGGEAAQNLEALLRKDPFNARALLTLARYYGDLRPDAATEVERTMLQKRNQQQAIIYYERAQNLDDDKERMRAFVGEAQLRVQRKELDKAADLLEEAQAITYQDTIQAYLNQIRAALKSRRS